MKMMEGCAFANALRAVVLPHPASPVSIPQIWWLRTSEQNLWMVLKHLVCTMPSFCLMVSRCASISRKSFTLSQMASMSPV